MYMRTASLPPNLRTAPEEIRTLCLNPPKVPSKVVMKHLVPDIVRGSCDGVPGEDPQGNKLLTILDCIGSLTDFAEASE